jgi:hypothetical protein
MDTRFAANFNRAPDRAKPAKRLNSVYVKVKFAACVPDFAPRTPPLTCRILRAVEQRGDRIVPRLVLRQAQHEDC